MALLVREVVLVVHGDPAPKGSLKCVGRRGSRGHVLVEDSDRTGPWRERVAAGGRRLMAVCDLPDGVSGPVALEVTFTVLRPSSHYGTGRNAGILKASAPGYPAKRSSNGIGGDVDKLARTILDALEDSGLLLDDSQVVELVTRKTYPDGPHVLPDALPRPGARIRLSPAPPGARIRLSPV